MASKYTTNRMNIYATPEDKKLVADLANVLHKQGVPGMLTEKGAPKPAAVIRYALKQLAASKS